MPPAYRAAGLRPAAGKTRWDGAPPREEYKHPQAPARRGPWGWHPARSSIFRDKVAPLTRRCRWCMDEFMAERVRMQGPRRPRDGMGMSNVPAISPSPRVSHAAGRADADAPPLTEAHFAMVRQAGVRRRKLTHAARVAWTSSAIILCIGVPWLLAAAAGRNWAGLLVAAAVCGAGAVEAAGCRRMRAARPGAGKMLGMNQLAFLAMIVLYCVAGMWTFSTEKVKASAVSPDMVQ